MTFYISALEIPLLTYLLTYLLLLDGFVCSLEAFQVKSSLLKTGSRKAKRDTENGKQTDYCIIDRN